MVEETEAGDDVVTPRIALQEPHDFGARDLARLQTVNAPAKLDRGPINLHPTGVKTRLAELPHEPAVAARDVQVGLAARRHEAVLFQKSLHHLEPVGAAPDENPVLAQLRTLDGLV